MGARRQGRRTTERLIKLIDRVTLVLSSVESDPIGSLRAIPSPLDRLAFGAGILDRATAGGGERETTVVASVRSQLEPLVELVSEANAVPPPFSPDLRQRIGYAVAVLLGLRARLRDRPHRLRSKPLLEAGDERLQELQQRWTEFRQHPSAGNLERMHRAAGPLLDLYWVLGLPGADPRVRGVRRLCDLLDKANERGGQLDEVPALLRDLTNSANDVCRPTLAEHRQWLRSVLA